MVPAELGFVRKLLHELPSCRLQLGIGFEICWLQLHLVCLLIATVNKHELSLVLLSLVLVFLLQRPQPAVLLVRVQLSQVAQLDLVAAEVGGHVHLSKVCLLQYRLQPIPIIGSERGAPHASVDAELVLEVRPELPWNLMSDALERDEIRLDSRPQDLQALVHEQDPVESDDCAGAPRRRSHQQIEQSRLSCHQQQLVHRQRSNWHHCQRMNPQIGTHIWNAIPIAERSLSQPAVSHVVSDAERWMLALAHRLEPNSFHLAAEESLPEQLVVGERGSIVQVIGALRIQLHPMLEIQIRSIIDSENGCRSELRAFVRGVAAVLGVLVRNHEQLLNGLYQREQRGRLAGEHEVLLVLRLRAALFCGGVELLHPLVHGCVLRALVAVLEHSARGSMAQHVMLGEVKQL